MKWYKKNHRHTLSSAVIVRSKEAKLTLQFLFDLAAVSNAGGCLLDNGRPYTAQQIVAFTGLTLKKQHLALEELAFHGLIQTRGDGTLEVLGWNEDQSTKDAVRQRKHRVTCHAHGAQNCVTCSVTSHADSPLFGVTCHGQDLYRDTAPPTVAKAPLGGADTPPPAEWVQKLLAEVGALRRTRLDGLGPDGLNVLARYHCLVFANCTRSESNNLANATKVAKGLAGLAMHRDYRDMTVAAYIKHGQKVHLQRKHMRWFDPWLIKAVVEFEHA